MVREQLFWEKTNHQDHTHMCPVGEDESFPMVNTADIVALLNRRKERHHQIRATSSWDL